MYIYIYMYICISVNIYIEQRTYLSIGIDTGTGIDIEVRAGDEATYLGQAGPNSSSRRLIPGKPSSPTREPNMA